MLGKDINISYKEKTIHKMVKSYLSILWNMFCSAGFTKTNQTKGIYHIKTWKGGRLHRIIGINNVLQVKELTVNGKINVTDLYFIQHMNNLEILNLKNAIYLRKKENEAGKNQLRRNLVKQKKHLKEIWFPNSMKSVPSELFRNCMELERVVLPNSIKTICCHAFSDSGIKEITIPPSVNTIEPYAFDNCRKLEKIRVEDSERLLRWKGKQFRNCPALHEIYLGRNSTFEYALTTNAEIKKLVLGKTVNNLNFDIQQTQNLVCLMKRPPHLTNDIQAEHIYVKRNFEHYWLDPKWNKKKLIKLRSESQPSQQ